MNNSVAINQNHAAFGKAGDITTSLRKTTEGSKLRVRVFRDVPALEYVRLNWLVLPLFGIGEGGRCQCGNPECKSPGKHPLTAHGVHAASVDAAIVKQWWARWTSANVGIRTGRESGIVVVDIDPRNGGDKSLAELEAKHGKLPETRQVSTGGGGFHYYFQHPGRDIKFRACIASGIDIKADGGYVVAPPSSHASGKRYDWVRLGPLAPLPEWLLAEISALANKPCLGETAYCEGNRNNILTSLAGLLRRKGVSLPAIEQMLLAENMEKCDPPLAESEVKAIASGMKRYSRGFFDGSSFRPERLARELQSRCHIHAMPIDEKGKGVNLVIYQKGAFVRGEAQLRAMITKELGENSTSQRILEVLELLREITKMEQDQFDRQALSLVNVKNGLVNWRTGKLLPHSPRYLSTMQFNAEFRPNVKSELLEQFLNNIFPADALKLVEEMIGYLLTPTTKYQKAFILEGSGSNGKSTFLKMVRAFIGKDLISSVSLQDLGVHRFKLAQLLGKTVNIYPDLPVQKLVQTDTIKAIIGGDTITGEHKYGIPFEFTTYARLLFSCNQLPVSDDKTDGFFRRLTIIPTPNKFEGNSIDLLLEEKLKRPEVLSSLLNRALAGLRRLEAQRGFSQPESVANATMEFRLQSDTVTGFASRYLKPSDTGNQVSKSKVYHCYETYCFRIGVAPEIQRRFDARISEIFKVKPLRKTIAGSGKERLWVGLALAESSADR